MRRTTGAETLRFRTVNVQAASSSGIRCTVSGGTFLQWEHRRHTVESLLGGTLPPGALPEDLVYPYVLGVVVQEPGQRAVRLDGGLGRSRARAAATSACFLSSISAIIWASSSASMAQAASCLAVLESDVAAIFSRRHRRLARFDWFLSPCIKAASHTFLVVCLGLWGLGYRSMPSVWL